MWPFDLFRNKDYEQSKTILVVDDGDVDRLLAVSALNKAGFQVLEAITGQEAIDMAVEKDPDLILLDFMLPDIKGPEVCETLKATEQTQYIPVIFLTSMDTPYSIIDGFDKGAENYLTKPIKPREIVTQVRLTLKDYDNRKAKGALGHDGVVSNL